MVRVFTNEESSVRVTWLDFIHLQPTVDLADSARWVSTLTLITTRPMMISGIKPSSLRLVGRV